MTVAQPRESEGRVVSPEGARGKSTEEERRKLLELRTGAFADRAKMVQKGAPLGG